MILRREARIEFDQAAAWYEQKRKGLGASFTKAIGGTLDQIRSNPEHYAKVFEDIREALVRGFPYCIYFQEEPKNILVLSIFHSARDPFVWQDRV